MAHSASTTTEVRQQHYSVPQPMAWPIMGAASLFLMALGGVFVMNGATGGWVSIAAGFMLLLYMMGRWFGAGVRGGGGGGGAAPRGAGGGPVGGGGGCVFPRGDEFLHLVRGDVFRR